MKKMLVLAAAVLAMVMFAGVASADSSATAMVQSSSAASVVGTNGQEQKLINETSANGNVGNKVNNTNINVQTPNLQTLSPPNVPFGKYERQVNDLPSQVIIRMFGCQISLDNVNTFRGSLVEAQGEKFLKKLKEKAHLRPTIIQKLAATREIFVAEDLPINAKPVYMGIVTGDAELDKEHLVYRQELFLFIAEKAMEYGANIILWVPNGDFFRAQLLPKSYGFGMGGVLGGILTNANPLAWGVSPQASYQSGSNVMYGDTGVSFALFWVDDPEKWSICAETKPAPPPVAPAAPATLTPTVAPKKCPPTPVEREIAERYGLRWPCLTLSFNNGQIHSIMGFEWVDHFRCSGERGDLLAAIEQFKAAEKNLLGPDAQRKHKKEARILLARLYKLWAGCIWQLYGRDAAMKFAKEKGITEVPAGIARW